ncbi:MAG: hypothetical protein K2X47_05210, partial [Bdellovibrionales bacterium]|nr:hypothetical protein [Bdellovibrionales bacterium]
QLRGSERIFFRIAELNGLEIPSSPNVPARQPPVTPPQSPISTSPPPVSAPREVCEEGFEWGEGRCVLAKQYITTLPGGLTCQPMYLRSYVMCGTIDGNVGNRQCILEDVKGVPTYYWTDCK